MNAADFAERTNDVLTTIRNRFGEPAAEFAGSYVAVSASYMMLLHYAPSEFRQRTALALTLLVKSASELAPFTEEQRDAYVQTMSGLVKIATTFAGDPT